MTSRSPGLAQEVGAGGRPTAVRVLMVCFNRLVPADQGNARRILQLASLYRAAGFEVDLLYHQEEGLDLGLSHALRAQFGHVVVMPSRASKRVDAQHQCRVQDWYDPALEASAREMHARRGYAVVHVNYIWYAPLLQIFGAAVRKVLDSHDMFADRAQKHVQAGIPPAWFSTSLAEEDQAFRMADAVLAIQREEAQEMVRRGHRHILYLPWTEPTHGPFEARPGGPELPSGNKDSSASRGVLTLGYLGSGNLWNVRSLEAFAQALSQRVKGRALPFRLVVAGGLARSAPALPGLMPLGFVKELQAFYASVDVAVNPMVGGTGLKIKTVEPLAFGCPVLATEAGAHGLTHLWQLPVLATPDAMAAFVLDELVTDPGTCLPRLRAQALASREAFQAEHDAQAARFQAWLKPRALAA